MATNQLVLSDLTLDFNDFTTQFEADLKTKDTWKGNLTTQTSQTLVELVSTVGTFMQGRLVRAREDSFSETAQSDEAIRSITQMQGLRMNRKLPAAAVVTLTSTVDLTLDGLTQFNIGSQPYFNKDPITLAANANTPINLYQGTVRGFIMSGLGSERQTFMSEEDGFQVSDQDVFVSINNTAIQKGLGGLWNYRGQPAFADLTTSDGRLLIAFGSNLFGSIPQTNDTVIIRYVVTAGASGNNQTLTGNTVTVAGMPVLSGIVTANPTGGADEASVTTYKNLSSGAFGTYNSAVTKSQYESMVGVYPGIVDAFTQSQRDVNPSALEWMNVIRVSGLTTSTWTTKQKQDFCTYMQNNSMYSTRFIWQDAIPVARSVSIQVFCFNNAVLADMKTRCEQAIQNLFAPRRGLLMTNFYPSDLVAACMQAGGGAISYVVVKEPTEGMIVTAPPSPKLSYQVITGGTLGTYSYSYGISTVNAGGEEGPPTNWVFPQIVSNPPASSVTLTWDSVQGAVFYKIYGRKAQHIGLIVTIDAINPRTFTDSGTATPSGLPPNTAAQLPIRYNVLGDLTIEPLFAERQQRLDNLPFRGTLNG